MPAANEVWREGKFAAAENRLVILGEPGPAVAPALLYEYRDIS